MSLLVFGSTALDSISTPKKKNPRLLGGSGSHAAVAASFFTAPKLIGVVGTDFPKKYISGQSALSAPSHFRSSRAT